MTSDSIYYIIKTFRYLLLALVILFFIRFFIIEPGAIEGRSMEPTLFDSDLVLVEKLSDLVYPLQRGELVQFVAASSSGLQIKRVIGLPGERLSFNDEDVDIIDVNGKDIELEEPYLAPRLTSEVAIRTPDQFVNIPANEYFLMGDNRFHSEDSRQLGPIHRAMITGRVFKVDWLNNVLKNL